MKKFNTPNLFQLIISVFAFLLIGSIVVKCFHIFYADDIKKEEMIAKLHYPRFINSIVVIEGCEYFSFDIAHGYTSYTHKGNCTNKLHSCKTE